jgi:hypothetical protein
MKRSWMVGSASLSLPCPRRGDRGPNGAPRGQRQACERGRLRLRQAEPGVQGGLRCLDAKAKEAKSKKEKGPSAIEPTFWPRFEQLADKGDKDAMLWCLANLAPRQPQNEEIKSKVPPMYGKLVDALLSDEKNEKPISLDDLTQGLMASAVQAKYLTMDEAQGLLKRIVTHAKEDNNKAAATMMSALLPVQALEDEAERDKQSLEVYRDIAAKFPKTPAGARARGQSTSSRTWWSARPRPSSPRPTSRVSTSSSPTTAARWW